MYVCIYVSMYMYAPALPCYVDIFLSLPIGFGLEIVQGAIRVSTRQSLLAAPTDFLDVLHLGVWQLLLAAFLVFLGCHLWEHLAWRAYSCEQAENVVRM